MNVTTKETPKRFTWTKETQYATGDIVYHQGKLYECKVDHYALLEWRPSATKWLWTPYA
jgi:chitodextrinase